MKSVFRFFALLAITSEFVMAVASPAYAVTEINWWHAMSGQLARQLEN